VRVKSERVSVKSEESVKRVRVRESVKRVRYADIFLFMWRKREEIENKGDPNSFDKNR